MELTACAMLSRFFDPYCSVWLTAVRYNQAIILQARGLLTQAADEASISEDRVSASKADLHSTLDLLGRDQSIPLPEERLSSQSRPYESASAAVLPSVSLQQGHDLELSDAVQRHRTWLETVLAR